MADYSLSVATVVIMYRSSTVSNSFNTRLVNKYDFLEWNPAIDYDGLASKFMSWPLSELKTLLCELSLVSPDMNTRIKVVLDCINQDLLAHAQYKKTEAKAIKAEVQELKIFELKVQELEKENKKLADERIKVHLKYGDLLVLKDKQIAELKCDHETYLANKLTAQFNKVIQRNAGNPLRYQYQILVDMFKQMKNERDVAYVELTKQKSVEDVVRSELIKTTDNKETKSYQQLHMEFERQRMSNNLGIALVEQLRKDKAELKKKIAGLEENINQREYNYHVLKNQIREDSEGLQNRYKISTAINKTLEEKLNECRVSHAQLHEKFVKTQMNSTVVKKEYEEELEELNKQKTQLTGDVNSLSVELIKKNQELDQMTRTIEEQKQAIKTIFGMY